MKLVALILTLISSPTTFAADGVLTNQAPGRRTADDRDELGSLFGDGLLHGRTDQKSNQRKRVHAVFRSEDKGFTWARSDSGLPGSARVNALEAMGKRVFAGTDSGVFVSSDGGRTWITTHALSDVASRVLCLAAMDKTLLAGTDRLGIVRTTNGGETWRAVEPRLGRRRVLSLLTAHGVVYAGTDQNGVFRSTDSGQTWVSVSQGIPAGAQVFAMAAVGTKIFAGLYSKGLYRFDELDQTWSRVGRVTPLTLASLNGALAVGHNPGGIFWSTDGGESWSDGSSGLKGHAPVWTMASGGGRMFAGVSEGIYYSADLGHTWVRARQGLPSVSPGVAFLATETFVLVAVVLEE